MTRAGLGALVRERRTVGVGHADPSLGDRVLWAGPHDVARNNAEVLLLTGRAARLAKTYRGYRHASYVAVESRYLARALPSLARHVARGRLTYVGRDRLGRKRFRVFAVTRPAARTARRYLSPVLGVAGLLDEIAGLRYVVLRWSDTLPELAPGEDLDLLVADDDLPALEAVLDRLPGTIPCDVYTPGGLPGTDRQAMAYYPPRLARRILDRAVVRNGARVPCAADAFDSLGYHAAFHKGYLADADHDYGVALKDLAVAAGVEPPGSLDALAALLADRGWAPPLDTLARLGRTNPFAAALHAGAVAADADTCPGLAVFLVRETALGAVAGIRERLVAEGFTILAARPLGPAARERLRDAARGGNWGRGPFPRSGGPPAYLLAAVDVMPLAPSARARSAWPGLDNERLLVKEALRDTLNAGLPDADRRNALHSSDNAAEALGYLRLALPESVDEIVADARRLAAAFDPAAGAVRDLTRNGRRARVEVVPGDGGPLVRKAFRPGCQRFLARERLVMAELAAGCPHLLPLAAEGPGWVAVPYVESVLAFDARRPRLLPLRVADAAVATARYLHDRGYALVDFTPANLLVDREGRTYVVDYEFLHAYAERPPFAASYDLAGPPPDFAGDLPVSPRGLGWAAAWQPYVGVPLDAMLTRPAWRRHLVRTRYRLTVLWPGRAAAWTALQRRRVRRHVLNPGVRRSVP
jgi:hypothetical protein